MLISSECGKISQTLLHHTTDMFSLAAIVALNQTDALTIRPLLPRHLTRCTQSTADDVPFLYQGDTALLKMTQTAQPLNGHRLKLNLPKREQSFFEALVSNPPSV